MKLRFLVLNLAQKPMEDATARMDHGESPIRHLVPGPVQAGMTMKPALTGKS